MLKSLGSKFAASLFAIALAGCATTQGGATGTEMAADKDSAKANKKIAFAIGRETGDFTVTNQQEGEAPGGYKRMDYNVKTRDGAVYRCYILEPSGLGKAMTWGMASGTDAVCNEVTTTAKQNGQAGKKAEKKNCNELLRAAGKC